MSNYFTDIPGDDTEELGQISWQKELDNLK
jgi:hypothetical protein